MNDTARTRTTSNSPPNNIRKDLAEAKRLERARFAEMMTAYSGDHIDTLTPADALIIIKAVLFKSGMVAMDGTIK